MFYFSYLRIIRTGTTSKGHAAGGAVGWGTALQAGSIPDGVIELFSLT